MIHFFLVEYYYYYACCVFDYCCSYYSSSMARRKEMTNFVEENCLSLSFSQSNSGNRCFVVAESDFD